MYAAGPVRTLSLALVLVLAACSNEPRGRRDAGRPSTQATPDGGRDTPATPANDGAAAATRYAGTLRGETEVPDGGLPDGATAWRGEGRVQLDVQGEQVEGRLDAAGMSLQAKGNLGSGTLRAWLRAPEGQPRTEGVLLGDQQGERLTGTWRVSGPGGAEIRAGTFEAAR